MHAKQSPQDFLRDAFTPQIGVLCSGAAESLCNKNNLSFIELLQPFCRLSTKLHYKDPNGTVVGLENFRITLVDVHAKPPATQLARQFLNSSVSECTTSQPYKFSVGDYAVEIPSGAPWFEAWRETFFHVQYPANHEFTKHLLACMLVVSTSDGNPVEAMGTLMTQLLQLQNTNVSKLPKWFSTNIFNYFVILHENDNQPESDTKAMEIFERMKVTYGSMNCFLLRMNSRPATSAGEQLPDPWSKFINPRMTALSTAETYSPEHSPTASRLEMAQEVGEQGALLYHPLSPETDEAMDVTIGSDHLLAPMNTAPPVLHGARLSTDDVEQIKHLVLEFTTRGLLPHVERQINQLSDFVANKKGVSRSLLSATKRWFTPNKPTSNSATINTLAYPADAPELQIRRLGDLYFMFGHYSMAYQAYHTAKREFMMDQAWLYCAGALEMASLAAFMAGEASKKSYDYMEESINTYLNNCKMPQFATKATLLSAECLRGQAMYGEAAHQLIRMASEDSDLRSALLLEQAAYCFLQCTRPTMARKYAFHMVLAGHRFTKAGQRKHSLRCYKQAQQVFANHGWNLAIDHILASIGRLAKNLDELEEAMQSYARLLTTEESRQTPELQEVYLKEYLTIHSELLKKQNNLLTPLLPLPIVVNESIKVLVGPTAPLRTPGKVPAAGVTLSQRGEDIKSRQRWQKLEEMLVQEAQGAAPMIFRPAATLFAGVDIGTTSPIAVIGEPIQVAVELRNPLQILLNLKDIHLLWHVKDAGNRLAANEIVGHNVENVMKTHLLKSVVVQAGERQAVVLSVTPLAVGEVCIKGIGYSLISGANSSENEIILRGKQMFHIKPAKKKKDGTALLSPGDERKIEIKIVPSAPCLQVSFGEMNAELLRNELQEVSVELRNVGSVPLHRIYMATSQPHLLSSCEFQPKDDDHYIDGASANSNVAREKEARKNHVSYLPLSNDVLPPGQFYNVQIWLKAPEVIGPAAIDLLIYYENVDPTAVPRYRLVRHVWHLSIQESIKVDASATQSCASKDVQQLALMVRATNLNKIHHAVLTEIRLLTAALLSHDWILATDITPPANVKLESQASYYLFLKMRRDSHAQQALQSGGKQTKNNYSQVAFLTDSGEEDGSSETSNSACLDFAKRNDRERANAFDAEEEIALAANARKRDAMLVLRWRANVTDSAGRHRVVYGQNQIPIHVTPFTDGNDQDQAETFPDIGNDIPPALQFADSQVTYNLLHPACVVHDFGTKKLCVVPVKLLLHSVAHTQLVIKVHTLGTSSEISPPNHTSLFYPYSSRHFRWIKLGSVSKTIEPLSSISVSLSVAVLAPGTYDLGSRLEVWCHGIDHPHDAVLQACRVQSSLIIASV